MSDSKPTSMSGVVAAVVTTFENGEALVKKIKENRAQVGAPLPPPALEQSLLKGPRAIWEAYETGWEDYGEAFTVESDRTALDAFKDILISLQGILFQQLFAAQGDNAMNDFGPILSASNMGRVKSVHVLNEMYIRMAEAAEPAPPQDQLSRQAPQPQTTPETQPLQQRIPEPHSILTSPLAGATWDGHKYRATTDAGFANINTFDPATMSPSSRLQATRNPGVASSSSSHSHTSSGATNITRESEEGALNGSPPAIPRTSRNPLSPPKLESDPSQDYHRKPISNFPRPSSVSSDGKSLYASSSGASVVSGASPEITTPSKTMSASYAISSIGSHMPFHTSRSRDSSNGTNIYGSPSGVPIDSGVSPAQNAHSMTPRHYKSNSIDGNSNKIPFNLAPSPADRKRLNNKPKAKRSAAHDVPEGYSRPSLSPSTTSSRKFSLFGAPKLPREDDAGFCSGAHLMQVGENGMKIQNQSVSFTGQNNYWTCSNSRCCFEGHAVPRKGESKKTSFAFDEDILEAYGLRYRWSFLAKCHTMIGNSKSGYEYQCVFCIGQGMPCFRVKGDRKFIQHVATHQGQTPNEKLMPPVNYVVGREASNWEQFDVNLPAPTAILLETWETPAELEAPEARLPEMEALPAISEHGARRRPVPSRNENGTTIRA